MVPQARRLLWEDAMTQKEARLDAAKLKVQKIRQALAHLKSIETLVKETGYHVDVGDVRESLESIEESVLRDLGKLVAEDAP